MATTLVLFLLLAVAFGSLVPVQTGSNATLVRFVGHPLYAAATNTAVATLVLALVVVLMRLPAPTLRAAGNAPWWAWLGGLYGATLVTSALLLAPRLGATLYVAATLAGTVGMSMLVDHFGLMAFPSQPITGTRLLGVLLVVAGMLLIARR